MDFYLYPPNKDWLDVVGIVGQVLVPVIVFLASVKYTNYRNKKQDEQFNKQLELQKEQWLNEAYIKNEAEVLLKAKGLLEPLGEAINSFYMTALNKFSYYFIEKKPPEKLSEDRKNLLEVDFIAIKSFYNLFAQNDNIFIKHGIDKKLDLLSLYLSLIIRIPKDTILEIEESKAQSHNQQTGEITIIPVYRYKFWYDLIIVAYRWHMKDAPADIQVDDEVLEVLSKSFMELGESLNKMKQYLSTLTASGLHIESLNNNHRQLFYQNFDGKLLPHSHEEF